MESFEHFGGSLGNDSILIELYREDSDPDNPGPMPKGTNADKVCVWYVNLQKYEKKLRYLAMLYLKKCDRSRYSSLYRNLQNQYSRGTLQYPHDLAAAYSMVIQHKVDRPPRRGSDPDDGVNPSGLNFLQSGDPIPGTDGVLHPKTRCHGC